VNCPRTDSNVIESLAPRTRRPQAAPMRLIRIDHVSLNVADRPRSIAWYDDVLGLQADGPPGPAGEPVFVGAATARLGLFADRAPGLRHVALATDDAGMARVMARLADRGTQARLEEHRDHRSLYVLDPDGTTVEVMVPTP
jgi:catechol 2,3-dioxygenase-like lactoylglutathione lyase family enzyme